MFCRNASSVLLRKGNRKLLRQTHRLSVEEIPDSMATRKMRGWQIHSYGDVEELQLADNIRIPTIKNSNDVLVRVRTAGVNPIDVAMLGGYGAKIFNIARSTGDDIEFPLTFGREFTGTIIQKGLGTGKQLEIGQTVWGVVPLHRSGSHAEYVVVSESTITELPSELNTIDGSAVLYSGLTAWAGLYLFSSWSKILQKCLRSPSSQKGKRVLVMGASGSVGSLAIQMLKAENATVIASCSTDAIPLVQALGSNHIIDYTDQSVISEFKECGPYDMILDCAGQGPDAALKYGWQFDEYITFSAPLLRNVDEHGLVFGMARNLANAIESNVKSVSTSRGCVKWAYFIPSHRGIEHLKSLVERKKLLPKVDSTYSFEQLPEAYQRVKDGHLRGKVVINFEGN